MANRFDQEKIIFSLPRGFYRFVSIALFAIIAAVFIIAVDYSGKSTIEKQQESLEKAISRDIVQCYAVEGQFPPNLEYMEEHYGLTYDKDTFFVDYQPIASNLYPNYVVILR
ncbi:MAG: hypothetical protein IJU77_08310 [Butyrivibrio sp.]|nr:hypothetical protein [Butyrivibrio sp.]